VDEIHLLYHWGLSFRVTLLQIEHVRARCPANVVTCALSATVAKGQVMDNVCKFLGFKEGQFHLIRRSNDRPEVQLLIRELQTALGGWLFPQLDWIIDEDQKTLIFTPTINLEFRVNTYLWRLAIHCGRDPRKFIRMYNSLNCPNYNTDTLDLMHNDPEFKILLSTDCLCVGFNCKHIRNVVIMGETKDMDEYVQKSGRPGRDAQIVKDPRGIYVRHKKGSVYREGCISGKGAEEEQERWDRAYGPRYSPIPCFELPPLAVEPSLQQSSR
jgi:superfamily II DNA/RNA helicase